ncbi:PC-Esterase domain-containing protein/PMR5N domain-containing protein [Cephalotus follicularis]|uniref:PC-Esterase domain-containing protein/PMR5N domain-containing protein n=1 Tax=Cephalotus follicularis TaxID=3775 RepID=A0A1Q3AMB2_CEPFO|nr:PC-Esterase domain-containing protein/PMR5N domain-containing protein [Cephalotus follicularis]
MVKEMKFDSNSLSLHKLKHNHIIVKFAVSFLLIGLAFRLFISDSISFSSSVVKSQPFAETRTESPLPVQAPVSNELQENESQTSLKVKCDLFTGNWIPDSSGPVYTNDSCYAIEDHQNCMKNGRPDSGYLYWRWHPRDCELPRFEPERVLDFMRNKSWAFIGDSISRNHVQSLLCILSQVEQAVEVYHDEEYRSKRWHFPSHNFTLSVIWTPFLIKATTFEDINGISTSEIQLYLDGLDNKWTEQYKNFDYAVIAGGKWFLKTAIYHENNTVTGCHNCPGKNLTELGFDYAYRKALRQVLNFVTKSDHKAGVFFRTTTPDHFENGEWFSGGTCNRTIPFKYGEVSMRDVDAIMRDIEMEEVEKAAVIGAENGVVLKLLDTTQLSLLRPDGHPGPYRQFQPFAEDKNAEVQNDCLHWCLPGPIDSWNDLVMEMATTHGMYR